MKLNIYENAIEIMKREKLKLVSGALILTTLFTLQGCKNKEKKEDTISINVVDEHFANKNGEYEYILNLDGIKDCALKESYSKFNLLKEVETEKYSDALLDKNAKTDAFFNKYNYLIFPSCYVHHERGFHTFNSSNSKRELELKRFEGLKGNEFILVRNSIEIKRNIDTGYKMLTNGQKQFLKGDKLESTTLICDGEVIAFKQTGPGSDCDNVVEIGNIDEAIIPVSSIINKDVNTNLNGAEDILEDMKQKRLKK